jgi:hypothetical protein
MSDNTGDESGFVPVTVGQFLINIRTATGDIASSIAINLYQSTRNAIPDQTPIYAFAPYFVFYRQGQAVGSAKYLRIDSHNSHLVKLRLGLYDDALKKACAVWLSNKTEQPISPQQLQILPIWSLEVKETVTSVTYNLPDQDGTGPVAKLNLQPVQDILFSATQDKAAALAAAIDGGYANFQFRRHRYRVIYCPI